MRVTGWERALRLVVERHMALPSQYGVSDCYVIADDAVEAVTGARLYPAARRYRTARGGARVLRRHGFLSVEDAFAAALPEIPVALAQRGDIGVVRQADGALSGGVFIAAGFLTRGVGSAVVLPHLSAARAFRVG